MRKKKCSSRHISLSRKRREEVVSLSKMWWRKSVTTLTQFEYQINVFTEVG